MESDLSRVSFTPAMRERIVKGCASARGRIERAGSPEFVFAPRAPFEASPYQQGWRLIGKSYLWQVEDACLLGDYDAAIRAAVRATEFGFTLTGGGATDASLGWTIVNESRKALAPSMERMSPEQLRALSAGIKNALLRKPPAERVFENEYQNMLLAVQQVQDAYRDQDFREIESNLGVDVSSAIDYLRQMKPKDREERPAYFDGFAKEAHAERDWLIRSASIPLERREEEVGSPAREGFRPWRRFARQFFQTCRPLLATEDKGLARTRLFILECELLRQVKKAGFAPQNLNAFTPAIAEDPLTGRPFVYRSRGGVFAIYSVGEDLKDDGGQSDETYGAPDLRLERPF